MALKRGREVELSVEREVLDASGIPRRLRVSARFLLDEGAETPNAAELAKAVAQLDRELEGAASQAGFRGPALGSTGIAPSFWKPTDPANRSSSTRCSPTAR